MTEYTVVKYDMEDYDNVCETMTLDDIVRHLAYIKRGHIADYNFSGDSDDFERYKLHTAMAKAIDIIKKMAESENKKC